VSVNEGTGYLENHNNTVPEDCVPTDPKQVVIEINSAPNENGQQYFTIYELYMPHTGPIDGLKPRSIGDYLAKVCLYMAFREHLGFKVRVVDRMLERE
jgi:hypothetical protein